MSRRIQSRCIAKLLAAGLISGLGSGVLSGRALAGPTAEIVFTGGPIHTGVAGEAPPGAVAVGSGRILYVGSEAGLAPYLGKKTRRVDLAGRALLPGFVDAGTRLLDDIRSRQGIDLSGARSFDELTRKVGQRARQVGPQDVVLGWGWDERNWVDSRPIRMSELQNVSGNRQVCLFHDTDDVILANQPLLNRAGLEDDPPDPPGGRVGRTRGGVRTGELLGEAARWVIRALPPLSPSELEPLYRQAADSCMARGVTTVHDLAVPPAGVEVLRKIYADSKRPPLGFWGAVQADPLEWGAALGRPPVRNEKAGLAIQGFSVSVDGGLNTRGAALRHPYADDATLRGYMKVDPSGIASLISRVKAAGWQPVFEAHGDSAVGAVLSALDSAAGARMAGADLIGLPDAALIERARPSITIYPGRVVAGQRWIDDRLGLKAAEKPWAWKSLQNAGAALAIGTDSPFRRGDPILAFHAAVARLDPRGRPADGWHPEEKLTREDALTAMTSAGAAAAGWGERTGRIAVGLEADLVVLSRDIMTIPEREIPATRVEMTVADGRVVFERTARP